MTQLPVRDRLPWFNFRVDTNRGRLYWGIEMESAEQAEQFIRNFIQRVNQNMTITLVKQLKNGSSGAAKITVYFERGQPHVFASEEVYTVIDRPDLWELAKKKP